MGDFNINLMKLNDSISLNYKYIPGKYDLSNVSEKPAKNGNALIDHIVTNTIKKVSSLSDHDAPFITINAKIIRYEAIYKFIKSFKNFDMKKYKMDVSRIPFSILSTIDDPYEQLDTFRFILISDRRKCFLEKSKNGKTIRSMDERFTNQRTTEKEKSFAI